MVEQDAQPKLGLASPDGVDGIDSLHVHDHDKCQSDNSNSGESSSESESEGDEQDGEDETVNGAELLAIAKSRLGKSLGARQPSTSAPPFTDDGDDDYAAIGNGENSKGAADDAGNAYEDSVAIREGCDVHVEEKKMDFDVAPPSADEEAVVKDQAYYLELAIQNAKGADVKAKIGEDLSFPLKLTEKNVEEAEQKAKADDESMSDNVIKPQQRAGPTRSENQELWALLKYSKRRLETGSTPQVGKKGCGGGSKGGSVRGGGGDDVSVSSKLSKSSRRSLGSKKPTTNSHIIEGGPGDPQSPRASINDEMSMLGDAPIADVAGSCDASIDGSVSLESGTKDSANEEQSDSDYEEESSEEEKEEEDDYELPDFLKDVGKEQTDPQEARALYEAAKFKAASILSVSEEKLTDVQMLQAIAIAEEAAKKGDEKFSTKRSLFKLNEAKVEDLKSFLNLPFSPRNSEKAAGTAKKEKRESIRWGIGQGRFIKKLGAVVQDFRERCDEIDDRKKQEREGNPTNKEIFSAAMLDLKAQVEEYERIVSQKKMKPQPSSSGRSASGERQRD